MTAVALAISAGDEYANIENLIGGNAGDRLIGNAQANTLEGRGGADVLNGGGGGDLIIGSTGNDSLTGGRGQDTLNGGIDDADKFIFNALIEGGDSINNFGGGDTIHIRSSALGAGADASNFVSDNNPNAASTEGTFLYDENDKTLTWDANGSDAGGRTLLFTIVGGGAVQSDDIILF